MSTRESFREMLRMIETGKTTEEKMIHAIGQFSKRKLRGDLEGWGLPGFVKHFDTFAQEATNVSLVYLVCEGCQAKKKVPATARNDYRHCSLCSSRLIMADDQAGHKHRDAWKRPSNDELPTLKQLEAVCISQEDKNPSLARIALAQIEAGAFRGGKGGGYAALVERKEEEGTFDPFDF